MSALRFKAVGDLPAPAVIYSDLSVPLSPFLEVDRKPSHSATSTKIQRYGLHLYTNEAAVLAQLDALGGL